MTANTDQSDFIQCLANLSQAKHHKTCFCEWCEYWKKELAKTCNCKSCPKERASGEKSLAGIKHNPKPEEGKRDPQCPCTYCDAACYMRHHNGCDCLPCSSAAAEKEALAKEAGHLEKADKMGTMSPIKITTVSKKPSSDKSPAAKKAAAEKAAAEKAAAEKAAAEKAERDRLAAEQAERDRLAAEQAERDRLAAEQAERERLEAEAAAAAAKKAAAEAKAAEKAKKDAAKQAKADKLAAKQAKDKQGAKGSKKDGDGEGGGAGGKGKGKGEKGDDEAGGKKKKGVGIGNVSVKEIESRLDNQLNPEDMPAFESKVHKLEDKDVMTTRKSMIPGKLFDFDKKAKEAYLKKFNKEYEKKHKDDPKDPADKGDKKPKPKKK